TPAPMKRSTTRRRLTRSRSPAAVNGVGKTEYTPSSCTHPPFRVPGFQGRPVQQPRPELWISFGPSDRDQPFEVVNACRDTRCKRVESFSFTVSLQADRSGRTSALQPAVLLQQGAKRVVWKRLDRASTGGHGLGCDERVDDRFLGCLNGCGEERAD